MTGEEDAAELVDEHDAAEHDGHHTGGSDRGHAGTPDGGMWVWVPDQAIGTASVAPEGRGAAMAMPGTMVTCGAARRGAIG